MRNHESMVRGFHWSNKAWYHNVIDNPEVIFGMYDINDGGTTGEMSVKWIWLNHNFTPKFECFDDGWSALSTFPDLIEKMGEVDSEDITDEHFVKILIECGFKDLTKYESPYK